MNKRHKDQYLNDWLKGNDLAFNFILDHYYPRLMAASRQMVADKEDAEELVMNVFLKIWQHRNQLSHVLKFEDYLFGILRQQISRRSRKNVLATLPIESVSLDELGQTDHPEFRLHDLKLRYRSALDKLQPRQLEIFLLSRDEELSQQEIADQLDLSINTVNNHITSTLKILRQDLKKYPDLLVIFLLTNIF